MDTILANTYELYSKAQEKYDSGEYDTALNLLDELFEYEDSNAEARSLAGIIKLQQKDYKAASEHFKILRDVSPDDPKTHYHMAMCYEGLNELQQALDEYQKALELNPKYINALNNSGLVFCQLEKYEQAEMCHKLVLKISPDDENSLINLGNLKVKTKCYEEAVRYYKKALKTFKKTDLVYFNLGNCYVEMEEPLKAIANFKNAISNNPIYIDALLNMGQVYADLKDYAKATDCYTKILKIDPDEGRAYYNLGSCFENMGEYSTAIKYYQTAYDKDNKLNISFVRIGDILWKQGKHDEAQKYYINAIDNESERAVSFTYLGLDMINKKNFDEALRYFDIALTVKEDIPEVHYNKSHVYFLQGKYDIGWEEYEWRLKRNDYSKRNINGPELKTYDVLDKRIFVYDEQGLGDSIQFVRFLPLLKERGAVVIFECEPRLECIFKNLKGVDELVVRTANVEPEVQYDYQISLLSLPHYLKSGLEDIPDNIPYLFADEKKKTEWQNIIGNNFSVKVGLVWAGNPLHTNDKRRSCKLSNFKPLFSIRGVEFFSFQKGDAVAQLYQTDYPVKDLNTYINNFEDTAAGIQNMDLIISVDTSTAHLAAAMGKTVWTLLPTNQDWRWIVGRNDTPWYPTMELFRQEKEDNWKLVIEEMAVELEKIVKYHEENFQAKESHSKLSTELNDGINNDVLKNNVLSSKKLIFGFTNSGDYGWGTVVKYLQKEVSHKISVHNIREDGMPSDSDIREAKIFQLLKDYNLNPLYDICGKENYGYIVFENELLSDSTKNSKRYNKVVTASTWCYNKLLDKGINNIELLIQGIDPSLFYPQKVELNENLFTVFSGGKLELRKSQDMVLKAFSILQKKYKDIILVTAWYNVWPQTMKLLATSKYMTYQEYGNTWEEFINHIYIINGIDPNRVITLPLVPHDKLNDIYLKTDVGLFPNRCEGGTNLVMMEYMACGKPVIASYNTGHKDILTESNSIMLKEMNPFRLYDDHNNLVGDWEEPNLDEIISKVEYAYHNRDRIKTFGQQAAKDLKRFSWANISDNLLKIVGA